MTLSDPQGHSPISNLFNVIFRAAVERFQLYSASRSPSIRYMSLVGPINLGRQTYLWNGWS